MVVVYISIVCLSEFFMGSYTDLTRRKRTQQKAYDPNNLVAAVRAVQDGSMNAYQAAQAYGVPRRTISYRVKRERENFLRNLRIMESMGQRVNPQTFPIEKASNMPVSAEFLTSLHTSSSSVESIKNIGRTIDQRTISDVNNMRIPTECSHPMPNSSVDQEYVIIEDNEDTKDGRRIDRTKQILEKHEDS